MNTTPTDHMVGYLRPYVRLELTMSQFKTFEKGKIFTESFMVPLYLNSATTLSITTVCQYAGCHYAECRVFDWYLECHLAECRYAECHHSECRSANLHTKRIRFCYSTQFRFCNLDFAISISILQFQSVILALNAIAKHSKVSTCKQIIKIQNV